MSRITLFQHFKPLFDVCLELSVNLSDDELYSQYEQDNSLNINLTDLFETLSEFDDDAEVNYDHHDTRDYLSDYSESEEDQYSDDSDDYEENPPVNYHHYALNDLERIERSIRKENYFDRVSPPKDYVSYNRNRKLNKAAKLEQWAS